ncbi:uncharacterized protein LOC126581365 [Anopheles aquasalis]|uniref:uncharacterized protein LOC126581365 n=1 Tax=Anopheles aquasalis TaxID=42839 RepID=UPI00215A5D1D|nr:uncharacterized protein LOC126581365 [Anopheles aquasalis]
MNRSKILFSILLALCTVQTVLSLSCFSCDHLDDDDVCEENFIECDAATAASGMLRVAAFKPSIQMIQSTNFRCFHLLIEESADRQYRSMGCSYDSVDVCQGEPRIGRQVECRWCNDRDGCNSAGSFKASTLLIAGLALVGLVKRIL